MNQALKEHYKLFFLYKLKKFGDYAFLKQFIFKSPEDLMFFEIFEIQLIIWKIIYFDGNSHV